MAGRGGRGAALLEALRQRNIRPGEEAQPPTAAPATTPAPAPVVVPVSGRAAGRASILRLLSARSGIAPGAAPPVAPTAAEVPTTTSVPATSSVIVEAAPPSTGRGRAGLLALARGRVTIGDGAAQVTPGPAPQMRRTEPEPLKLEGGPPIAKLAITEKVEKPPVVRRGECGIRERATANFVRLQCDPDKGLFEYEVKFQPDIDSRNMRFKVLNLKTSEIGGVKTFDGSVLYLPIKLPDQVTVFTVPHPVDNSEVVLSIIFKRKRRLGECIHLYNVLFNKIFKVLHFARLGRQHFNPQAGQMIPQHKLEIWPGYVTAIDEYEGGIMLNINASHRVLRMLTCLDVIQDCVQRNISTYQDEATKALVGASVLTRYNNKLYRVDDITFAETPLSTFKDRDGSEISFAEYYKKQYDIDIKDKKQPLLINRPKSKVGPAKGEQESSLLICLVPELCYMTGLTDTMRNDFKIMKDIAVYTRITPNQRQMALKKFLSSVRENETSRKTLSDWGLTLAETTVDLECRVLPRETIIFGKKSVTVNDKSDWGRDATSNAVLTAVDLLKWVMIHVPRDTSVAENFVDCMKRVGPQIGIHVENPRMVALRDDRTESYLRALRENISSNVQVVVTLCPTARDDRYAAIKKLVCADMPVANQVINTRTISKPDKLRSVVQKIALQINCKLGGSLWAVKIPFEDFMVCGVDTYHDASRRGASVAGFVASLNPPLTRWFSKVCFQGAGQELVDGLKACFISALKKYYDVNGRFPSRIVMFRDGVGDGQLNYCAEWEIPQLKDCFKLVKPDYEPKLTVVIVQKRINARIFRLNNGGSNNPAPGTVVDHTITRRDWYDFFLVSQFAGQGTVTPTHFVVVYDGCEMKVDHVQRLSYKLTHMYYNWPGTVRVPAPCQYAHKLAYLVGQNIHREPSEKLSDRLYFL